MIQPTWIKCEVAHIREIIVARWVILFLWGSFFMNTIQIVSNEPRTHLIPSYQ